MKRNLRKKLSKEGYRRVSRLLREIKEASCYEEAKELWEEVVRLVKEDISLQRRCLKWMRHSMPVLKANSYKT